MFDAPLHGGSEARVWDLPLRLFHWFLLAAVLTAAISGFLLPPNWLNLHIVGGTTIVALLLFRLLWGFTGTTFSRFRSFVFSPRETLQFLKQNMAGAAPHHDGHNPAGAAMIFALLGCLTLITITGVIVLGGAEKQGPLKAFVSYATGSATREIHELFAYGLLLLILGHIAGVVIESRRSGVNLPKSMVTGRKTVLRELIILPSRPVAFAIGAIAMTMVIGGGAFAMWRIAPSNVPSAPLDAGYVKDCGDCHIPFHPSLRGAATWAEIMDNLSDHFGEDASLDAGSVASLSAYLKTNAAERWDTRAANVLRAAEPLAITDTEFWKRRHADIDPGVFKQEKVGTKSNCEACHGDARQGLFTPQAINIPKE